MGADIRVRTDEHEDQSHKQFQILQGSVMFSDPYTIDAPVAEKFCARSGRREVQSSIFGRACRPRRPEFSLVFSETRVNTG